MKFTISTTDVKTLQRILRCFDRQMTYYEDSKEYVFEYAHLRVVLVATLVSTPVPPLSTTTGELCGQQRHLPDTMDMVEPLIQQCWTVEALDT